MTSNKTNRMYQTERTEKQWHPLLSFLYLMILPLKGWKKIKNTDYHPDTVSRKMFFPLMAIVAAGMFLTMIYNPELSLSNVLQRAIVIFVSFFFGYYAVMICCGFLLSVTGKEKIDTNFGKVFIMMNMSALILFYIIYEAVPMLEPVLIFTPIYVIYMIFRGIRFLRIKNNETTKTAIILCFLTIGIPLLVNWLFLQIMPEV